MYRNTCTVMCVYSFIDNFALNYNVCVQFESQSRLSKYMLKSESIETTKITYNIPVTTGCEDDCKIIHPEAKYLPRRSRGKKLLSKGAKSICRIYSK